MARRLRVAGAALAAVLCGSCERSAPPRPPTRPSAAPRAAASPVAGPITYFNTTCVRCHGPYASFDGEGFARELGDAALATVVREMTIGPAGSPLPEQDLAALIAYHRSLREGTPFVAVTAVGPGVLGGEATPGSVVTVHGDGRTVVGPVSGHAWSVEYDTGRSGVPRVEVRKGGTLTVIDLADTPYSHGAPPTK